MANSPGKAFERQLRLSLQAAYPMAWVIRHTDSLYGAAASAKSPPDLQAVGVGSNDSLLLIECKATMTKSVPWDRVASHQLEHLEAFNDAMPRAYGCVAVLHYNGLRGYQRRYDAWLIPVTEWLSLRRSLKRKSLPLSSPVADVYLAPYQMQWMPQHQVFDVASAVSAVTGSLPP